MRADANGRVTLALAPSILEALGSRASIHPVGRHKSCSCTKSQCKLYAPSDNRKKP